MQPRTTAAIDVPSISLRFSTDVVGSSTSRQQLQQQHLDHDGREPDFETKKQKKIISVDVATLWQRRLRASTSWWPDSTYIYHSSCILLYTYIFHEDKT